MNLGRYHVKKVNYINWLNLIGGFFTARMFWHGLCLITLKKSERRWSEQEFGEVGLGITRMKENEVHKKPDSPEEF